MKYFIKLINLFAIILLFASCTQTMYISNSSFIVKGVDCMDNTKTCEYKLQNIKSKKKIIQLKESSNKYQIGDTLILLTYSHNY